MSSALARSGAAPRVPARDLARLRALSRELSAALADLHEASAPEPGSPGASSLARLIRAEGGPHDEVMLGVLVPQSRLLAVTVPDRRSGLALVDQVGAEGRVVALLHSDELVLLLVPDLPSRDGSSRSREAAERIARLALRVVPSASVGISSPVRGVVELPLAVEEACRVDRFEQPYAFADENWAALGVARLAEQLGDCLTMSNPLRKLMANEMLLVSVRAWLEHDRNVPAAAESLGLHRNTLRYRLGRVQEVTGLCLDDPDALLLTALLLRREAR